MANEESLNKQAEQLKELTALKNDYMKILKEENSQIMEYLKAKNKLALAERTGIGNIEELKERVDIYRASLENTEEEVVKMTEEIERQSESIEAQREQLAKSEKRLASFRAGLDKLTNSTISSITSMKGFFDNIVNVTFALESQSIGLARTTGYTKDFADNLTGLTKRNAALGISLTESAQIISGLSTGMARFNALGDAQQSVLEDISARFMRLGVDSKEFGSALDTINYAFGLTGQAAAEAGKNLEGLASEIGKPLDSVVQDLNDIGPALGRFGQQGIQVFRKLATQARELGLTTKQAFDVSELFDTFEGAANIAGRLNAQLGLQLNSVEIMKASSEERLDILRSEFQLQGKNFESMGRRQKQMIANILGQDEETAARLLGDNMDISRFQKEKVEEKTITDMVKMQEQMTNLMQKIALPLSEHLLKIAEFVKKNYDVISKWVPIIAGAVLAIKGVRGISGLLSVGGRGGGGGLGSLLHGVAGGIGSAILRMSPLKKIAAVGALGSMGYSSMRGKGEDGFGRKAAGLVGGLIGAGLPLIGGIASAIPSGGAGLAIGLGLSATGGVAGSEIGHGIYDTIFGAPSGPSTTNAEMNTTMSQNREAAMIASANGQVIVKELVLRSEIIMDKDKFGKAVAKVMNVRLDPVRPN